MVESVLGIDRQHVDGDPPDVGQTDQASAVPFEVIGPNIISGIEEAHSHSPRSIEAGDIRPLVVVAVQACEREVVQFVGTSVLFRDDVVHLEGQGIVPLRHSAILADSTGSSPDRFTGLSIHRLG